MPLLRSIMRLVLAVSLLSGVAGAASSASGQPFPGSLGTVACSPISYGSCASQSCDYCAEGPTEVNAIAVSADGSRVILGGSRGSIVLYDGGTGEVVWDDSALCPDVHAVAISSDGAWFAAGTECRVYLFHESSATPVVECYVGDRVNSVALSSDGQHLAAGAENGKVIRLHASSSTPVFAFTAGGAVNAVAITPDGAYIAAGSDDTFVRLFQESCATPRTFEAEDEVQGVVVADDGSYVAGGDGSGLVRLWEPTGSMVWEQSTGAFPYSLSLSSSAGRLVASNESETVYCLDATTGALLWERYLDGEGDVAYAAVSSDGARVAAGCDGKIQVLDATTGAPLCGREDPDFMCGGAAVSSDGAIAAFFDDEEHAAYCLGASDTPLWTAQPSYRCDASDVRPLEVAEITDIYYEADGGAQHGRIKPLAEVVITGRHLSDSARLYWGANREQHEDGTLLSMSGDTELRVLFTAVEDGWFVSNHDSPCISVYNDGDCGEGFVDFCPVTIDQRDYVEEVTQGLPTASLGSCFTATWWTMDEPDAVIIVRDGEAHDFSSKLARVHTVTGVKTAVVSLDDLRGLGYDAREGMTDADNTATANAVKEYIQDRYDASNGTTRFFVLWGEATGAEGVPTMRVYDSFEGYDRTYSDSFLSDFFFANFSRWDSNGNGVHNDNLHDAAIDHRADVGVSRIPFLDRSESYRYIEKAIHHLAYYDQDAVGTVLALSNRADYGFDSAWWLETYTLDRLPYGFDVTKLYELNSVPSWGAEDLTVAREEEGIEKGPGLIIHMGHGSTDELTCNDDGGYSFTGDRAHELENPGHYPIMISGACHAGSLESGRTSPGAKLVSAPFGGAVAYIGNSTYGASLKGGCQLIDAVIEELDAWHSGRMFGYTRELLLTEAYQLALNSFTDEDGVLVDETVWANRSAEEWTAKGGVLLGDGLLPVHTWTHYDAPEIGIARTRYRKASGGGYIARFAFTISPDYDDGAITLYSASTGRYYPVSTYGHGTTELLLNESPDRIAVGYTSCSCLNAYKEVIYSNLLARAPVGQTAVSAAGVTAAAATPTPARPDPTPIPAAQAAATPLPAKNIPMPTATPATGAKTAATAGR